MYKKPMWFVSTLLTLLLAVAVVFAQSACSDLVFDALDAVDTNCSELGRNEACYGYDQVEVSFLDEIGTDTFSEPADLAPVADIETIRTAPLNLDTGVWGVAVMSLQANMPNTLPGQNVTFILLGDVELENAVAPEDAFQPADAFEVEVSVLAGANIRSGPGTNFNVIGGAGFEAILEADGRSEDGDWLRVAYRERPAWISSSVLIDNEDIALLPTLAADLYTPMQAVYLRTGIGEPECDDAPDDILLVQGPDNVEIALNVNGADITLGSSGALRVVEIDGQLFLEVIVFDGVFVVAGVPIHKGQSSLLCLSEEGNRGLDGNDNDRTVECVNPPQPIDPTQFGEQWCVIEGIPSDILHYGIDVLCPGESPPVPPAAAVEVEGEGSSESEIGEVDCSTFSVPPQTIPANNFTLSWSPATGADKYIIAVIDSSGFEVSTYSTSETSISLNGGVGFPNSGSIHVRAYQGEQYACVATIGFTRAPDPNVPPGGYPTNDFSASLVSCSWPDGMSFTVKWVNAEGGVTVSAGSSYSWTSSSSSGSMSQSFVPTSANSITVKDGSGSSVALPCPSP